MKEMDNCLYLEFVRYLNAWCELILYDFVGKWFPQPLAGSEIQPSETLNSIRIML